MTRTFLLALFLSSVAAADEIELIDGTVLEGKVTDLGDSIRITRGGASIVYPKSSVKRIEYKQTREELYEEKAKALKEDDLEGHLALARWCLEHKLREQARKEFQRILTLDPDHEEARDALGYRKYNGAWLTEDEIKQAQGLVRHRGKWVTPEERDLDLALETQKEMDREIAREIREWLGRLGSSKEAAQTRLAEIEDRYKVKPFLAALASSSAAVRQYVVEELGRMKEPSASKPLARRAVWDPKEEIRASAVRSLLTIQHPDTALYLVPYLAEDATPVRIRAEEALSYFADLRAVPPLLSILSTTLETLSFIEQYENQMAQLVRRTLLLKSGRRIVVPSHLRIESETFGLESKGRLRAERDACETALRAITGQDFGEDVPKWSEWYQKNKK